MIFTFDMEKILTNVSSIKLPGGVVGKTSIVLIVASLSMLGIALVVKVAWICAMAISFIFILVGTMSWRLISFADKNPQAALFEGAEFLLHEKIQLAAKNIPNIPDKIEDMKEDKLIIIDQALKEASQKPDQEINKIEGEGKNG